MDDLLICVRAGSALLHCFLKGTYAGLLTVRDEHCLGFTFVDGFASLWVILRCFACDLQMHAAQTEHDLRVLG